VKDLMEPNFLISTENFSEKNFLVDRIEPWTPAQEWITFTDSKLAPKQLLQSEYSKLS
jgi:hypothetical protein